MSVIRKNDPIMRVKILGSTGCGKTTAIMRLMALESAHRRVMFICDEMTTETILAKLHSDPVLFNGEDPIFNIDQILIFSTRELNESIESGLMHEALKEVPEFSMYVDYPVLASDEDRVAIHFLAESDKCHTVMGGGQIPLTRSGQNASVIE